MNINSFRPLDEADFKTDAQLSAAIGLAIADPLYYAEKAGLERRLARAKARGEDTAALKARIDAVDTRLNFYDDVLTGFCGVTGVRPVAPEEYETVVPTPPAPATKVMPKLTGAINQVGALLAPLKPKVIKVEGKEGRSFAVVKQVPAAGAPLPENGHYDLVLQAPPAWTKSHVVLIAMVYRLAPEWLGVANYVAVSDKVAGLIEKVVKEGELARLKTDGDRVIAHWVAEIVKQAGSEVKSGPLTAALKFAVALVK